jgi:hypothetical protein
MAGWSVLLSAMERGAVDVGAPVWDLLLNGVGSVDV